MRCLYISPAMQSNIVPQISVSGVSWHVETVDRLNAMVSSTHHMETFFRSLLLAHRRKDQCCCSNRCIAV